MTPAGIDTAFDLCFGSALVAFLVLSWRMRTGAAS